MRARRRADRPNRRHRRAPRRHRRHRRRPAGNRLPAAAHRKHRGTVGHRPEFARRICQRPLRGPRLLDVGTLLEGLGVDPIPHVGKDVMVMRRVLDIHWLAECALRWFPAGRKTYDAQIAALIREVLRA